LATQFKINNGIVIVIRYQQVYIGPFDQICEIASPGMCFSNLNSTMYTNIYSQTLQAFCDANCFCRANEIQYKNATTDRYFASCIKPVNAATTYDKADMVCSNLGSHLPPIYELEKLKFLTRIADSQLNTDQFWIGLRYYLDPTPRNWYWRTMDGNLTQYIDGVHPPFASGQYSHNGDGINNCALMQRNETIANSAFEIYSSPCDDPETAFHYYMCQSFACDTDNYCPDINAEYFVVEVE